MLDDINEEAVDAPEFSVGIGSFQNDEDDMTDLDGCLLIRYERECVDICITMRDGDLYLQQECCNGTLSADVCVVSGTYMSWKKMAKQAAMNILDYVRDVVSGCGADEFHGFHDDYDIVLRDLAKTIKRYIKDIK